jgi:tRNA dimethylallyltransferase
MSGRTVAVLIAGPTASGKSAFAAARAAASGGVVINADSMQVYDVLNVLTARPQPDEQMGTPHHLYGVVPPSERYSTGAWVSDVSNLLSELEGRVPEVIFVGGTGLYFKALTDGIADIPEVPEVLVQNISAEVLALDRAGRAGLIESEDPEMAARLSEPDPQRLIRALAVKRHTGRSLAHWQDQETKPLLEGWAQERIVLNPPRELLNARIATRFETMFDNGAVEEVASLMALGLDKDLPAMKAIGVREISAYEAGEIDRETAIEKAVIATRQYAKRQRTWFRNQMPDWRVMTSPDGLDAGSSTG